jgi:ATP-dependent helicase HrpB
MTPLPIDDILPDLLRALASSPCAVVVAPPGAGKSTRVPPALLGAGLARDGEIAVLQPRRIAARLLAARVAGEMGERPGGTVGYRVRFEEAAGPRTRIRYVTEGILTRRLIRDPDLRGVSVAILDEFHERHLHTDLALALLRRLQLGPRPDLRIVVMSATIDPGPVARHLGGAPVLRSEGRLFDVAIDHVPPCDSGPLETMAAGAAARLLKEGLEGDVLFFLPGAAGIRRCAEALSPLARRAGLEIAPLHGDLPLAEQERALRPGKNRKLILATNVAESSITVEGVTAVVDSGQARIPAYLPSTGMNVLSVARIAKASARQRAGRAGRLRPGRCVRLYSRQDFAARPENETPEIARLDLCETVLLVKASGAGRVDELPWLEPPPPGAVEGAEALLVRLGALAWDGSLTAAGRAMQRLPLHPRLSRLVLEAAARGQARDGAMVASILGEPRVRRQAQPRPGRAGRGKAARSADSDVIETLEMFESIRCGRKKGPDADTPAPSAVLAGRDQILRLLGDKAAQKAARDEDVLLRAILAAFPDRVGKRRAGGRRSERPEFALSGGGSAVLDEGSVVRGAEWIVAVEIDRRGGAAPASTLIRQASAVEPDWILELFIDAVAEKKAVTFNAASGRVEAVRRIFYDQLVIDESPDPRPDEDLVAQVLFDAAWARGLSAFDPDGALDRWLTRVEFVRTHAPGAGFPPLDEEAVTLLLREHCRGRHSLKELADGTLVRRAESRLTRAQLEALGRMTPERVILGSGRKAKVSYPRGGEPFVEARIQDFFGMKEGPSVAGGRVPLVLHLLAPSMRPVQVTTDLAGFWERHYPALARQLRRRYPRHAWPDNPLKPVKKSSA